MLFNSLNGKSPISIAIHKTIDHSSSHKPHPTTRRPPFTNRPVYCLHTVTINFLIPQQETFMANAFSSNKLRKHILIALGSAGLAGFAGQAAAISPNTLGILTAGATDTQQSQSGNPNLGRSSNATNTALSRAWADATTSTGYTNTQVNYNYGWTHNASFVTFQVGSAADIAAGTRFNVTIDLQGISGINSYTKASPTAPTVTVPVNPLSDPGFTIWTSGTTPFTPGAATGFYGHSWSQVRGGYGSGGVAGDPCANASDCALGSNGWMSTQFGQGGDILPGMNGFVGYANAGYSFTNYDGDMLQGLYAGVSNPNNIGQYGGGSSDPLNGTALTNVNSNSPIVQGGGATLSAGNAMLTLDGLQAGYYLIGFGGSCADNNGLACTTRASGQAYSLTISNDGVSAVPLPGAAWLFGSSLISFAGFARKFRKA
jgi:hypothetical protein